MKIIKKNQLTILVLALMLVTAGYLNYTNSVQTGTEIASLGDATLVSASISNNVVENTQMIDENNIESNKNAYKIEVEQTSQIKKTDINDYFATTRLDRDTMYSQMLESYQKIIDSQTSSSKQKEAAQKEIDTIHKNKNSIMIAENLIKAKGIEEVVILINDDSISVIAHKEKLEKEDIAQIQSIIAREMNAKIEDIHIQEK